MTKPFRFGVQTHSAADPKAWRDRARHIEALGYSTMYIPDHFGDQYAPLVALTVAAEATDTLNVGALVFDNDYRHPLVLAKEIATLDLVSSGRVEFGIGAGWMKTDYDEAGMPYDSPGVRVTRMEEGIKVMKALWTEGTASFEGEHYKLTNAQGLPKPYTQPHPKVLIGGGGKRVLSIAAREADIVGVNPNLKEGFVGPQATESAKPEYFHQRLGWIKDAAGSRFEDIELQVLTFVTQVVPNKREVIENMAPLFGVSPEEAEQIPLAMVGTVDEICDTLRERRETFGFNYVVVQADAYEAFAPVVEKLAGT
ncbi:MAG TPA: TIGR03621 family F420-dependent LLM class oxidoreductase [Acidimicrobiales bacterium]|nr:TIGR03621 family F420-dependent LLM class oxidoreductase [Acidimicrobiales bacterium]